MNPSDKEKGEGTYNVVKTYAQSLFMEKLK